MAESHNDVKFPRQKDDTVKFLHFRAIDERGNVNPRGGVTIAYRADPSYKVTYYGAARCSEDDNFKKDYGRLLSSARLRQMSFPDTGIVYGYQADSEKDFAKYMESFIQESFGYRRKFSRKNRKHG